MASDGVFGDGWAAELATATESPDEGMDFATEPEVTYTTRLPGLRATGSG